MCELNFLIGKDSNSSIKWAKLQEVTGWQSSARDRAELRLTCAETDSRLRLFKHVYLGGKKSLWVGKKQYNMSVTIAKSLHS